MKLSTKRLLAGIMIAGDLFMVLIGLMLIFEEDLLIFGLIMLGLLAADIYLTIDYIRALKHREQVEESLKYDNLRASEIRQRYQELSAPKKNRARRPTAAPAPAPKPADEEDDLSELLTGPAASEDAVMRR